MGDQRTAGVTQPAISVPEYRIVVAPILWDVASYRGVQTLLLNVQDLPAEIRETINELVPLNQPIDQLEALVRQAGDQSRNVELAVFGGDLFMHLWNSYGRGVRAVRMCWSIDPSAIHGVLGQVRTALTELVVELRIEVGESSELPSADKTDQALQNAINIIGSTVTIVHATTKEGDIMPDGGRTTIKDNKISVSDVKGNVVAGSAHVTQTNVDTVDVAKVREFAALVNQIAPTLGFGLEEQAELEAETGELEAAANDAAVERGRIRHALSAVMKVLGRAGSSAAKNLAVTMGDELTHQIGQDIIHQLPH
jgi:hypothetical protein